VRGVAFRLFLVGLYDFKCNDFRGDTTDFAERAPPFGNDPWKPDHGTPRPSHKVLRCFA